jgi:hypothetical protein
MSSSGKESTSTSTSTSPEAVIEANGLATDEATGTLEPVAYFNDAMPTGVTVSHHGRIFVNFPRWGDNVKFTVGEIRSNEETTAYPDEDVNEPDASDPAAGFVSVQSVVVDPADHLWILDTGSPLFQPPSYGGPKLVCIDLKANRIIKKNSLSIRCCTAYHLS